MPKSANIHARLSADEGALFEKYAQSVGLSRSRLLRKIIRELITEKPDMVPQEVDAIRAATRQLSGIATNFNQIARRVNTGELPSVLADHTYFDRMKADVDNLKTSMMVYVQVCKKRWVPKI